MSAELVRPVPSERTEELCGVVRALEALGLHDIADQVRVRVLFEDIVFEDARARTHAIHDEGEL